MTKTNVPRLRFNGFNKELEKVKYSDVFDSFQYGLNKSGITFDGINKYLRITDIDDETRNFNKNKLVSPNITNKEDYESYILRKNDILFARTGASTGKTYLYKETDGKVYYAGFLIKGHVKNKFDSHFIFFNTLTSYFRNFVKIMSIRSGQPGINSNEYSKYELYVPNLYEQQKIGEFFAKQDKLIELQTQKVYQLKKLKRGYLQKLFPQEGETVPRLRFSGFSEEWKEVTVGEIVSYNNQRNKSNNISNVESISNKQGFVRQTNQFKDYSVASSDLSNYFVISQGMFAYNPSRINVGSIAYKDYDQEASVVSPLYISFKTKKIIDDEFFLYWFKTDTFRMNREKYSEGGVRDTLSFKLLSQFDFRIPNFDEQQKIGSFLAKLDKLIEEQSDKLDQLKQQKKAYLQKMFI